MPDVTGQRELYKKLRELEPKLARGSLRRATRKGARLVADMQQSLVPIDEGLLHDSIRVRAMRRARNRIGHDAVSGGEESLDDPWYAGFVNFGTRFQEASLYATQAFLTMWPEAERIAIAEIKSDLAKMGKKVPG